MKSQRWRTPFRSFGKAVTWSLIFSNIALMVTPAAALPTPRSPEHQSRSGVSPRVEQAMRMLDVQPGPAGPHPTAASPAGNHHGLHERVVPGQTPSLPVLPDTHPRTSAAATPLPDASAGNAIQHRDSLIADDDNGSKLDGKHGNSDSNEGDDTGSDNGYPHGPGVDKGLAYFIVPGASTSVPPLGWSRQTYPGGQYFSATGNQSFTNDHAVWFGANYSNLSNPGTETLIWDVTSPVAGNNITARHTAASLEVDYTSSGGSPSALNAHYTAQWKVYDGNHPAGYVVRTDSEDTQLTSIYVFAGLTARDAGTWSLTATRSGSAVDSQQLTVADPPAPATGPFNRRGQGNWYPITSPLAAYTMDEWLMRTETLTLPAPANSGDHGPDLDRDDDDDCDGRAGTIRATWNWTFKDDPTVNTARDHSYMTVDLAYKTDGKRYRLNVRVYDPAYPQHGRLWQSQSGKGTLSTYTLNYGEGLPRSGNWQLAENVTGQQASQVGLQERELNAQISTGRNFVFYVDNGVPFVYTVSLQTLPASWNPSELDWTLTLTDPRNNSTLKTINGSITDSTRALTIPWDGSTDDGGQVSPGAVVAAAFHVAATPTAWRGQLAALPAALPQLAAVGPGPSPTPAPGALGIDLFTKAGTTTTVASGGGNSTSAAPSGSSWGGVLQQVSNNYQDFSNNPAYSRQVDPITGFYRFFFPDMILKTRGLPIVIGRHYVSTDTFDGYQNTWGWHWHWDDRLDLASGYLTHHMPDGSEDGFQIQSNANGSPTYVATRPDCLDLIVQEAPGRFRLTHKDKSSLVFQEPAAGGPTAVLSQEVDRNGNANTYTWDGTGTFLQRITDPAGRVVRMTYNSFAANGQALVSVTDWTGRSFSYGWQRSTTNGTLLLTTASLGNQSIQYKYRSLKTFQPVNTLLSLALTTSGALTTQEIDATNQLVTSGIISEPEMSESSSSDGSQLIVQPAIAYNSAPATGANTIHRQGLLASAGVIDVMAAVGVGGGGGGPPPPPGPTGNLIVKDTTTGIQQAWNYTPDANFNITQIQDPQQGLQNFTFDPARNILSFLNENRNLYKFSYDNRRNPTSVTDAANNTTTYQWQNDNLVLRTDGLSGQAKYTYDAHSNPLTVTDEENHTNTYTYLPSSGQLSTAQDALGNKWIYKYDANGYLNEVDEPAENGTTPTWHFVNDLLGRRTRVTDPNGHVWQYSYDVRDRLTQITLPALPGDAGPVKITNTYNEFDQVVTTTDPDGNPTTNTYDPNSHYLTKVTYADGSYLQYKYDAFGNVTTFTNPSRQNTQYIYDKLNRPTQVTYPNLNTELYTYDALGHVKTFQAGSVTVGFQYNSIDKLQAINSGGIQAQYTYDKLQRRATLQDATGTTTYTYLKNSLPHTVARPLYGTTRTLTATYNWQNNDLLASITDPEGIVATYTWTPRHLMASVSEDGLTVSYVHDAAGNLTQSNYNGKLTCQVSYDARNRLTQLQWAQGASKPIVSVGYARDEVGNITGLVRQTPAATQSFSFHYDSLYQLTSSTLNGTASTYSYDANHNRTSLNGASFSYNAADQLNGDQYDDHGNVVNSTSSSGQSLYDFNYVNLVTTAKTTSSNGDSSLTDYTYDGDNVRIHKSASITKGGVITGVIANYFTLGNDVYKEYDGNGNVTAQYLMGLKREAVKSGGAWHFYVTDHLGSTLALTDTSGNVTDTYQYDDWGNLTKRTGSTYNPFLYTGQQYDAESGLYFLRARYYQPTAGRFLERDPAGYQSGSNLYDYVGNRPINATDASGMYITVTGDSDQFLQSLGALTGYDLHLVDGKVQILGISGPAASGYARIELTKLIDDKTYGVNVVSNSNFPHGDHFLGAENNVANITVNPVQESGQNAFGFSWLTHALGEGYEAAQATTKVGLVQTGDSTFIEIHQRAINNYDNRVLAQTSHGRYRRFNGEDLWYHDNVTGGDIEVQFGPNGQIIIQPR